MKVNRCGTTTNDYDDLIVSEKYKTIAIVNGSSEVWQRAKWIALQDPIIAAIKILANKVYSSEKENKPLNNFSC